MHPLLPQWMSRPLGVWRARSQPHPRIGAHGRGAVRFGLMLLCALAPLSCDAQLEAPHWLWAQLVVLAVAALLWRGGRRRAARTRALVPEALQAALVTGVYRHKRRMSAALALVALAASTFALAGPQVGFVWEDVHQMGIDLVVALDVSESMMVRDGEVHTALTRLALARRKVIDLLRMLDGDRVALVAFAGAAYIECPLTADYAAAELFLEDFTPELIPIKGTALDRAIQTSLQVLGHSGQNARAIILITDGEDHSGALPAAAQAARAAGVRIYPIGIGRDEGAPIPLPQGGFHRDARGGLVLSRLDEAALQQLAAATGGKYVRSMHGDLDLESIYAKGIRRDLTPQDIEVHRRRHWHNRFIWPLGLALLAWAGQALILEATPPHPRSRHA